MTVHEAYMQGCADLKVAEVSTPALDASILLSHVISTTREKLIFIEKEKITEEHCVKFFELIKRRVNGECVAYIIGKKEFYGLEFYVNKNVLVPRPETELLVEIALNFFTTDLTNQHEHKILDLCTGSGAIAIALKHEAPELEVHATDISLEALETAKTNARRLLPNNNTIIFYQGDLFKSLHPSLKFKMIVSNPPYVSTTEIPALQTEVQHEPLLALDGGEDGLEIIRHIIEESPNYLEKNGALLLEADPRQMDDITILLAKRGFFDIQLYKDLAGNNRVIGGKYV